MLFRTLEWPHCLSPSADFSLFLTLSACPGGRCHCNTWHRCCPSIPVSLGVSRASTAPRLRAPQYLGHSESPVTVGLSQVDQSTTWNHSPGATALLPYMSPHSQSGGREPCCQFSLLLLNACLRDQEDEANGTLMKCREKTKSGGVANTEEEGD